MGRPTGQTVIMKWWWGLVWLGVLMLASCITPLVFDPNDMNLSQWSGLSGPSWSHWLGTDDLGRDVGIRVLDASKVSLGVGILSMLLSVGVGTVVGSVSGYVGGRLDRVIQWGLDVVMGLPTLFIILMIQSVWGPSLYSVIVVIGLSSWMPVARLVRVEMLRIKNAPFMLAVRTRGLGQVTEWRHAIPAALIPIRLSAMLGISQAILAESVLGFLGLGVQPPQASWGSLLQNSVDYMGVAPWMAIAPGVMIVSTILIVNTIGDAMQEASRHHVTSD